ncbi:MAG: hypothetical protein Q9204_003704 [Flavoplaca sp. TL-2023a]
MRLIDTWTYEIREISPGDKPTYAILSHTWGDDEYVFSDRHDLHRRQSAGFKKISSCCALAAGQGYEHLWVDTCCIDKTSSAELTESINSMYRWYEEAKICYVYLSGFCLEQAQHGIGIRFQSSRWFTRGWTLQELLAPEVVVFYDADWTEIGSKTFLKDTLSEICCINIEHLSNPKKASVATKMSWASKRQTTREEDIAYSLLGLFGVNMPLIYGEGANAFFRLQCEIIRSSADESLFAWRDSRMLGYSGLLATSPRCFEESGGIVPIRLKELDRPPYFLTNQGLSIEVELLAAGRQPDRSDDFKKILLANRDSRLKGRHEDCGRPNIVKTVLGCAREHIQEAPVMLTLGIIDGKLASRINCDSLEYDSTIIHVNESVFSIQPSPRQTYSVGWQRGYVMDYINPAMNYRTQLPYTTYILLTSTFREVFTLNGCASRNETTVLAGKSVIVRHLDSRHPPDTVRLQFGSSLGYGFSLEWDDLDLVLRSEYFIRFVDFLSLATNRFPLK